MDQYKLAQMRAADQIEEAERARLAREARDRVGAPGRQAFWLAWSRLLAPSRPRTTSARTRPARPGDRLSAGSRIGDWSPVGTSKAGRMR
jgi:hypothetical protein